MRFACPYTPGSRLLPSEHVALHFKARGSSGRPDPHFLIHKDMAKEPVFWPLGSARWPGLAGV